LSNSFRLARVIPFAFFSAFVAFGQVAPAQEPATPPLSAVEQPEPAPASWEDSLWLPVQHMFKSLFESRLVAPVPVPTATAFEAEPGCSVAPLQPIDDAAAQQLEGSTGSNVVDVADMVPAAARALNLFQSKVVSVGGTMILKSAYRPAAYQKHLQDVWYKWMGELKDNHNSACQGLRTLVQEEFARHRLIETQHPVGVSDHTRGLAFDATVDLSTVKKGRRLSLDKLARLAGLLRPAIVADPVHFKFLGIGLPRHLVLRRRRFNA
jgi:D-alanyl-D-alanine dipeptidase